VYCDNIIIIFQSVTPQYIQCVHFLNVPVLCFHIWPDDGSFEPKHVARVLILITMFIYIYIRILLCY